jgi:murein DD-endopeptidase MepM/ murein hydrolase activator NlpD
METKARDITGLAPRQTPEITPESAQLGGKGGPANSGKVVFSAVDRSMRPPNVIYGLSRPSADLILQEIRTRTQSLRELVVDMEAEKDRIARIPSIWPIKSGQGIITSQFGYRIDPINGHLKHHDGTDISASYGSPIQATARGVVVESTFDGDYGNLVIISHGNGLETWYGHMSMRRVKVGDVVDRHDIIGNLGSTGRSTGAHLHYEVHTNGKSVDAEKYLRD